MNIDKLFSCQGRLDNRIVVKKGLQGVDLLDKKILALLTELGELANEWQMFKFWKNDPEPNIYEETECHVCDGESVFYLGGEREVCGYCEGEGIREIRNPLLVEYVDCLHFILSIGNDVGEQPTMDEYEEYLHFEESKEGTIIDRFIGINFIVSHLTESAKTLYDVAFFEILHLGKVLGFTTDQIEQAYFDKNKINHARQESGY